MNATTQPQDLDAERAILGACLMSPQALDACRDIITGPDFYRPAHETIWDALRTVHETGEPADAITVANHLRATGQLDRAGGQAALHDIAGSVAVAANATYYAHIVAGIAVRRRVLQYATRLAQDAANETGDTNALISDAGARLDALSRGRNHVQLRPLSATISGTLDQLHAGIPPFEPSPWAELDEFINGWRKGGLHVIGARPGGFKSVFGLQSALATARAGKAVTYSVMEMDQDEVNVRLLAQAATVGMDSLSRRKVSEFEFGKIDKAIPGLVDANLYVDDTPGQTVEHIRAHARAVGHRHDLGMIVVDYLQQVEAPAHLERAARYEQVGNITRSLKKLAREMDVPVLAMAQVGRPKAGHTGAPNMSDLRESGDIEADADAIVLLHPDGDGHIEAHVRKARQGRLGTAHLKAQGLYARLMPTDNYGSAS